MNARPLTPDELDPAAVWQPGDHAGPPLPDPADAMFYGPLGDFALDAAEHSEADPVAVLAHTLVLYGAAAGRGPHLRIGNTRHPAATFALIVGDSAKARKGTALAVAQNLMGQVDRGLMGHRVMSGFGSGEAVAAKLAPKDDAGSRDCRLVVVESEFAALLARGRRDGSTISATLRDGWDGRPLENRTKTEGDLIAADYHLCVIGHIVADELRARLADGDRYNGFANRFLHFAVRRRQLRRNGGNVPDSVFTDAAQRLRSNLDRTRTYGKVDMTPAAAEAYWELRQDLEHDDPPGLLGSIVARADVQAARLALVLALADGEQAIAEHHVTAARACWDYCRASAGHIFGDDLGDPMADWLLAELRAAGPGGLSTTQATRLKGNHDPARIDAARARLVERGLAVVVEHPRVKGRPEHRTYALRRAPASERQP